MNTNNRGRSHYREHLEWLVCWSRNKELVVCWDGYRVDEVYSEGECETMKTCYLTGRLVCGRSVVRCAHHTSWWICRQMQRWWICYPRRLLLPWSNLSESEYERWCSERDDTWMSSREVVQLLFGVHVKHFEWLVVRTGNKELAVKRDFSWSNAVYQKTGMRDSTARGMVPVWISLKWYTSFLACMSNNFIDLSLDAERSSLLSAETCSDQIQSIRRWMWAIVE